MTLSRIRAAPLGRLSGVLRNSNGLRGLMLALCSAVLCTCSGISITSAQNNVRPGEFAGNRVLRKLGQTESERTLGVWFLGPSVVFEDRSSRFWVGNVLGLYVYDEPKNKWRAASQGDEGTSFVRAVCQDLAGAIWILSGIEPRIHYLNGAIWQVRMNLVRPLPFVV